MTQLFGPAVVVRREPLPTGQWRYWLDNGLYIDRVLEASARTHGWLYEAFDPHVLEAGRPRYVAGAETLGSLRAKVGISPRDGREGPDV